MDGSENAKHLKWSRSGGCGNSTDIVDVVVVGIKSVNRETPTLEGVVKVFLLLLCIFVYTSLTFIIKMYIGRRFVSYRRLSFFAV